MKTTSSPSLNQQLRVVALVVADEVSGEEWRIPFSGSTSASLCNGGNTEASRITSPYLNAKEAAAYIRIPVRKLYGIVERGQLQPLRGPRKTYLFTSDMLDTYLRRMAG